MTTPVMTPANSDPRRDDARADRQTFAWLAGFFIAFLVVDILSRMTEIARTALDDDLSKYAVYEVSSLMVVLGLLPATAWVVTRAMPGQHGWRFVIGVHALASIIFSLIHVGVMVAIRKIIFVIAYGYPYVFVDNIANDLVRELIYEYRKDVLTYVLIVFFITLGRELAHQRRELAAASEDAKKSKRLTLKSGGRSIWVDASDVRWVKSVSNYVEVAANGKTHLARATLASVELQLADAGAPAVRVHRSYVVNTDHIREICPTGEGDVKIKMNDGAIIPGSRRYRYRLPSAS